MTPLGIEILFHYHCRANDYRDGDLSAPAVRELISAFSGELGSLMPRIVSGLDHDDRSYRLTPCGSAYVEYLQSVPLPECHWRIPEDEITRRGIARSIPTRALWPRGRER